MAKVVFTPNIQRHVACPQTDAAGHTVRVLTTDHRFLKDPAKGERWLRLANAAAMSRSWGDCYGYLLVATGRADVMVDPSVAAWDAAPFLPVITEAGGVFTDWEGVSTAFGGSMVATNAGVADSARALLGVSRAPHA